MKVIPTQTPREGYGANEPNKPVKILNYFPILPMCQKSTNGQKSYSSAKRLTYMKDELKGFASTRNLESKQREAERKQLPKILMPNEIKKLLSCCDEVQRVIIQLYLRTGMRLTEALHLKVSDIDFINRRIFVRGKFGKERIVPLENVLAKILQGYITKYGLISADYILCVKRAPFGEYRKNLRPYSDGGIYCMIRMLAEVAGLQELYLPEFPHTKEGKYRVHPHLLRHTALTMIEEASGDPFITKEIAGHEKIQSTERYIHMATKKHLRVIDDAFKEINGGGDEKSS